MSHGEDVVKNLRNCLLVIFSFLAAAAHGQSGTGGKLESEMISSWLVTVVGENRTRTLKIKGLTQRSDGLFDLNAAYGWTDEGQGLIKAELSASPQETKLIFTTQADSKIVATQEAAGRFSGTFTLKNGTSKGITIVRVSDEAVAAMAEAGKSERRAAAAMKKPAADVPAACGALAGKWQGEWPSGQKTWLSVVEVDARCVV